MKLKDQPVVHIVAIIDRSGSMNSIHDASISGFNEFISAQKAVDGPAKLSLVLFDDKYEVVYDDVDLKDVPELTKEVYTLGGMTAMNDAIGRTRSPQPKLMGSILLWLQPSRQRRLVLRLLIRDCRSRQPRTAQESNGELYHNELP
jgi:hypothetical protein